jgi:hypothetical protein
MRGNKSRSKTHWVNDDMKKLDYRIANNAFDTTVYGGIMPSNPLFIKEFQQNYDQQKEDIDRSYGIFEKKHKFKRQTIIGFAEHVAHERAHMQNGGCQ